MSARRIVAIGLLTEHDLKLLGSAFDRLWPVEETPRFDDLLEAIDRAEEKLAMEGKAPSAPDEASGRGSSRS